MTETSGNMEEELEAWREVHKHLTNAVLAAREGVAAAKAQRRFWMEEICANLTSEGKLVPTSVWKRAVPTKARKAPKKSTNKTEKAAPKKSKKKKTEGDGEAKPKKKKASGKRKKKAADDGQGGADTAESSKPPKKAKLRLSLKPPGGKPKKKSPMKTNFESDNEEPSAEQNYPNWPAPRQQLAPPPGAAFGMQQAPGLSAAEHFAMMQNVPAELLPFLAPQPAVDTSMAAAPMGMRQPSMQPPMYPNAYANFPQASSDDDSSEED